MNNQLSYQILPLHRIIKYQETETGSMQCQKGMGFGVTGKNLTS